MSTPIDSAVEHLRAAADAVATATGYGDRAGSQRIQIGHDLASMIARLRRLAQP